MSNWTERLFCRGSCINKIGLNLDLLFYKLGVLLGRHPVICICTALLLVAVSGLGLTRWREELDNVELFMPYSSHVRADARWVQSHFKDEMRFESLIVEADNVLAPEVLAAIADLDLAVHQINASGNQLEDVCTRYDSFIDESGDKDSVINQFKQDPAFQDILIHGKECLYQSILKLWKTNGSHSDIYNLKEHEILDKVTNSLTARTKAFILEDIKPLLSKVSWDESHMRVLGAKATFLNWMLKKSDNSSEEWELEFVKHTVLSNRTFPAGMKIYGLTTRSYDDYLHQALESNKTVLYAGFTLIILYVVVMLGRWNTVEQRIYLSLMGVSVVGQSILSSYGICFYLGYFWGPIHPILPFLLLGLGVDNTFVIVQCLDNVKKNFPNLSLPEKVGKTLQQAGVSITITSLTDTLAFAIGTTTVMPFLRSFCVFAATGILCLYVFEILFFVSCLALDELRLESKRDGCFCKKQVNWIPNDCSQRNIQRTIFTKYVAPSVLNLKVKVIIFLTALTLFGANMWCIFKVEQKFDPMWYLNPESYPLQFSNKLNEYFPQYGKLGGIYMAGINIFADEDKLHQLAVQLEQNEFINNETLDIWHTSFINWLKETGYDSESEDEYKQYLAEFLLLTQQGPRYFQDFRFTKFPDEGYEINAFKFPLQHIVMDTTEQQVKAMTSIFDIVKSVNFTNESAHIVAYSPDYVSWMANKIIGEELLRNLGLTLAAVAMVTLFLIRDLFTTLWVNCCVIFTVVDLVGSMYWLGLTIEISTSIMVLLCAGLSVDYAAHIGYEFTRLQGTKNDRAKKTISIIGSAVFNGGFSTFLAFALLGSSHSYLFTTFFKLFTGVVIYGLFHGLLFLPVVLSWFGPTAKSKSLEIHKGATSFDHQNGTSPLSDETYIVNFKTPSFDLGENKDNFSSENKLQTISDENGLMIIKDSQASDS